MAIILNLPANDTNTVDMKDPNFSTAMNLYSPANGLNDADMNDQEIPTATTPSPPANDNDIEDMHKFPLTPTSYPNPLYTLGNSNIDISWPGYNLGNSNIDFSWAGSHSSSSSSPILTPNTTPPSSPTIDWDTIDPNTGLRQDITTALSIIDSCDFAELCRFNAPLLADPSITVRQQVEMYFDGGESEAHRRKRLGLEEMGKRASVVDKVAGVLGAWKRALVEKGMVSKAMLKMSRGKRDKKAASI